MILQNVVVATSPKLDSKTFSQLSKDNGFGKQGSPTAVLIQKKNNNNNNQNNNNNNKSINSVLKAPPKQKQGKSPKSKKGKSS